MKLGSNLFRIILVVSTFISFSQADVWQRVAVDSSGNDKGYYCKIAIDNNNDRHLVYYDQDNWDLRYARCTNGIWTTEIVDSIGNSGQYCNIALDNQNRPHISYQQYYSVNNRWVLKYATLADTGWFTIIVDEGEDGESGEGSSIAINQNGYPLISYIKKWPTRIAIAYLDQNGWHVTDVREAFPTYVTFLVLENGDNPLIGFNEDDVNDIERMTIARLNPADSTWSYVTMPDTLGGTTYGKTLGFDIDSQNNYHVGYKNPNYNLKVARYDGQNWTIDIVIDEHGLYGAPGFSFKMDKLDQPSFAIFYWGEVYLFRKTAGQWLYQFVDDGITPTWCATHAFDSNNIPHIGVYGRTLNYTRYALFYYRYWPGDPLIVLPKPFHNFGTVWTQSYSDWECPVENLGDAPLFITDLEFTSNWWDTAYKVLNTPLPRTILPQDSDFITIRFQPDADGPYFDTLKISSNDSLNSEKQITLQGIGTTSGTNGNFILALKNAYINHQYQLLRNDLPLENAEVSLLQNNQVIYGPLQTGSNGEVTFQNIVTGDYDLGITKQVNLPGNTAGSTLIDHFSLTLPLQIGPGTNTMTVNFPESLLVEKYYCVYDLTHIERTSWNYSQTFHYPAEENVRGLLNSWKSNLPPDVRQSIGRLVIAENMTGQMFDPGYSIGKEFMMDIGELMNLVLYSENWGTSIAEILGDIIWGLITGDWTALLIDILMEVLQEFLQDMLLHIITEGIHQVTAEIGSPGEGIINGAWNVVKSSYSGWSLGTFSQISWNSMAGEIYHALRDPIFQLVYIEELTDDKIDQAKNYSQNFNYNGEFRDAYDYSNQFVAGKRDEIEDAETACEYLRGTANLFNVTAGVLSVLGQTVPIPFIDIIEAISIAMQITAYVEVVTALGISGYEFFTLPGDIEDTVNDIYFPEGMPVEGIKKFPLYLPRSRIHPETIASLERSLLHQTSEYDSVLSDIKSKINAGEREEAILELKDLMIAENHLRNSTHATCAPIYAVASFAQDSINEFQHMYDTLKYRYADAGEQRYKNYIYVLFSVSDSSTEMKEAIVNHLDKSSNQNHRLTNHVITTLDTVSSLPMPAIVVATLSEQSAYGLGRDASETIKIQLQNVGALAAEDVNIVMNINEALSIAESDSIYIGTINPGSSSDILTWTVSRFGSNFSRGIWTTIINSSNAKTYSTSGSFTIQQEQTPGTAGKLNNENIYNYPNPFNPDKENTTLRYSLEKTASVTIKIFDAGGNLVRILLENVEQPAREEQGVIWDGKNGDGYIVANGVYFFAIETSQDERAVGKIAVLR